MQGVKGPGFWNVDDARILLPEDLVVPQPPHPEGDQHQGDDEGEKEEPAIAVHDQPFPFLMHHQGHQGKEGEDEEDKDLSFCDQIPAVRKGIWLEQAWKAASFAKEHETGACRCGGPGGPQLWAIKSVWHTCMD